MNKYQRVVAIVIAANIALMLLFPPFLDNPIRRGVIPNFEGFYPLISALGNHHVHGPLLALEIIYAMINGLIAWLVLDRRTRNGEIPKFNYARGLLLFAVINLAFLMLFPPFESFSALVKIQAPTFDGFYFALGDKRHRHFFAPLLYMEVILVSINLLVIWLLFNTVRRTELAAEEGILELAKALPPEDLLAISNALQNQAIPPLPPVDLHLGDGPDRRRRWDPRYRGPDRRHSSDRRHKPRTN